MGPTSILSLTLDPYMRMSAQSVPSNIAHRAQYDVVDAAVRMERSV
jgi:hypothetical protein